VLLGAVERGKTFGKNTHLQYMQGLIRVLQNVTISLSAGFASLPPSKAARPSSCPYSSKCLEVSLR
jgi:hypothetical protein